MTSNKNLLTKVVWIFPALLVVFLLTMFSGKWQLERALSDTVLEGEASSPVVLGTLIDKSFLFRVNYKGDLNREFLFRELGLTDESDLAIRSGFAAVVLNKYGEVIPQNEVYSGLLGPDSLSLHVYLAEEYAVILAR